MEWSTVAISTPMGTQVDLQVAYGRSLYIGREIHELGLTGWQPATTAALFAAWDIVDDPSQVFFDVGANIGVYAQLHNRLWPSGRAVAFEPTPHIADCGEKMTAANALSVRWERAAVSDRRGETTLYLSTRSDASNSLVHGHRRARGTVTVPTVMLDDFCEETALTPSVVKIDVERHEPAVVRGASRLLATHRPIVVAELLPGHVESEQVRQLMYAQGYTPRLIGDRDWLFWPSMIPAAYDDRLGEWLSALGATAP